MSDDYRVVRRLTDVIVERPQWIVVLFLALTAGFATGLDDIEMESGTDQFSEDVDAFQLDEYVDDTFGEPFDAETDATLLLQDADNVLDRESLLRMLSVQRELADRPSQRVEATRSPATFVALELDPTARSTEDQIRVIRSATDVEVRTAVRSVSDDPEFTRLLGADFNARSASSSAAIGIVTHDTRDDTALLEEIQRDARGVASAHDGDIRVFGGGITEFENRQVLRDSLSASIPAVVVLLVFFLAVAYRDPFDLVLGIIGLGMALVWTFGFLGLAGIPFSQLQVALPPLLLAIGVDFGIHIINRYREEYESIRTDGGGEESTAIKRAVRRSIGPLAVAFFMVMTTSVIGFSANMASGLSPIADFGLVAAVGIVSVTLIFGVFLPAGKVILERLRGRTSLFSFTARPLGASDSILGRLLPSHLAITAKIPALVLIVLVLSAGAAGIYGQDVGSSFETEDMLPPEELPGYLDYLPDRMQPGSYTVTGNLQFLESEFETTDDNTVTIYVRGSLSEDHALESIHRANEDPPSSFVTTESRQAEPESILTVIESYRSQSESFDALVETSDRSGNGIPDSNLEEIYDELLASPYGGEARRYLTPEYREARLVYAVEADATDESVSEDAASMAAKNFRYDAVATGDVVVFQAVSGAVYDSAVRSLLLALVLATGFLTLLYHGLERRPMLGPVTLSPILMTVLFLVATMRYLGIPFNTLTATILSVTVGIGVDYAIHVVHRFVEEFNKRGNPVWAARVTLRGTGGALFGTTITTAGAGIALYSLSVTPILVQFGGLIALSVTYSFIASTVFLPVVLLVWARWDGLNASW
ncbi:MAG: efflux RND transporter permease subunit [Natronomonas sp.]